MGLLQNKSNERGVRELEDGEYNVDRDEVLEKLF
ncbi:hypothetical protein L914_17704 [Phytophthora nicotianae]|uniref:Uncharacterized protein n=1 Tax=Phytophthora nicotianae TaxID=4792 RepID=W2MIR6_PHYNI|nr:hypothetical protein L914_17704 [Phytophthora nicotianae]